MSKVAQLDPNCFLQPVVSYENYFYELYISMSIPYFIDNSEISNSLAKIMATVELLEQEKIYTKITMVLPVSGANDDGRETLVTIPLFGHKETKCIERMSSQLNERTLRKFYFAIVEDRYKTELNENYGRIKTLPRTIAAYNIDEEELCSEILNQTILKGKR